MASLVDEHDRISKMMSLAATLQMNEVLIDQRYLQQLDASTDPDVQQCVSRLVKALKAWKQPLDFVEAGSAFEAYAEALVLMELQRRASMYGFVVRRLPERQGAKTPDFECAGPENETFFIELKTLDMAHGVWGAKSLAEAAFANQVALDARKQPGIAFGEPLEIAPHGPKVGPLMEAKVLDLYIQRINNNVSKEQLTTGPTFLMVFGQRLPLDTDDPSCLVPAYFFESAYPTPEFPGECVSGEWWHVGFGRSGDLILTQSEFEGKGNARARLLEDGVLTTHPYIFGLSIVDRLMSESQLKIYTLVQSDRQLAAPWGFDDVDPSNAAAVFSDAYNDARNGHGIRYQVRRSASSIQDED